MESNLSGEKRSLNVQVDERVIEKLEEYLYEKKGKIYGEKGKAVEQAILEWIDHDRYKKIENRLENLEEILENEDWYIGETESPKKDDLGSDKDKPSKTTLERLKSIEAEIKSEAEKSGGKKIHKKTIENSIENNAGGSYKTIRRYKEMLTNRNKIFLNPLNNDYFFVDATEFVGFIESAVKDDNLSYEKYQKIRDMYDDSFWSNNKPKWLDEEDKGFR